MPNGSLLQQYRPKGVWKVVSNDYSSSNCTCLKPFLASSFVNTLAPWRREALQYSFIQVFGVPAYADFAIWLNYRNHRAYPLRRNGQLLYDTINIPLHFIELHLNLLLCCHWYPPGCMLDWSHMLIAPSPCRVEIE